MANIKQAQTTWTSSHQLNYCSRTHTHAPHLCFSQPFAPNLPTKFQLTILNYIHTIRMARGPVDYDTSPDFVGANKAMSRIDFGWASLVVIIITHRLRKLSKVWFDWLLVLVNSWPVRVIVEKRNSFIGRNFKFFLGFFKEFHRIFSLFLTSDRYFSNFFVFDRCLWIWTGEFRHLTIVSCENIIPHWFGSVDELAVALSMSLIYGQNVCTGWRCQLNWCLQKQHEPLWWKWLEKCSLAWIAFPLAANCTFLADARSECENAHYIARIAQIKKNPFQPMAAAAAAAAARATTTYNELRSSSNSLDPMLLMSNQSRSYGKRKKNGRRTQLHRLWPVLASSFLYGDYIRSLLLLLVC